MVKRIYETLGDGTRETPVSPGRLVGRRGGWAPCWRGCVGEPPWKSAPQLLITLALRLSPPAVPPDAPWKWNPCSRDEKCRGIPVVPRDDVQQLVTSVGAGEARHMDLRTLHSNKTSKP